MIRLADHLKAWPLLLLAFVVRLATLGGYPLTDNTEARYAEIARKMLETGHWIVPQIDYGVPFWGKPPLSFWLTAIFYKLFGVNEFAARLPSLLLAVAVCALAYTLACRQRGADLARKTVVVIATTVLMMVSAGGVMTDPAMLLGTALSMTAFWLAFTTGSRRWGYLFFVGIAIGLMAKGPVATALTLLPIGAWAVLAGRIRSAWRAVPWITGTSLSLVLVIPWYWAAEQHSPGFLHYFLVGEHWQRFTVSGWKGDLYGSGHPHLRGTIWMYGLLAGLPWAPWLLWRWLRGWHPGRFQALRTDNGWTIYLLSWMLAPLLFFTLAANILPTYVLSGLVGFGILTAEAWCGTASVGSGRRLWLLGLVVPVLAVAITLWVWPAIGYQSQKGLIAQYRRGDPAGASSLTYLFKRPASAEFYSRGRATVVEDLPALQERLAGPGNAYFVAESSVYARLPEDLHAQLRPVIALAPGKYLLLRHVPP